MQATSRVPALIGLCRDRTARNAARQLPRWWCASGAAAPAAMRCMADQRLPARATERRHARADPDHHPPFVPGTTPHRCASVGSIAVAPKWHVATTRGPDVIPPGCRVPSGGGSPGHGVCVVSLPHTTIVIRGVLLSEYVKRQESFAGSKVRKISFHSKEHAAASQRGRLEITALPWCSAV